MSAYLADLDWYEAQARRRREESLPKARVVSDNVCSKCGYVYHPINDGCPKCKGK